MGGPRKAPPLRALPKAKQFARVPTTASTCIACKKAHNPHKALQQAPPLHELTSPWTSFLEVESVRAGVHTGSAASYAADFGRRRLESPSLDCGSSLGVTPVEPKDEVKAPKLASTMERKVASKLGHVFALGRRAAWKLRWSDAPATFKAIRAMKDGTVSHLTDYPVTELAESASRSVTPAAGMEATVRPNTSSRAAQRMCIYVFDHETGDKHPLLISMTAHLTDVKAKAASALGIDAPLGCMCMCVGGRRLADHRTLLSYGIRHGECLHLMLRRGVNQRTRRVASGSERSVDPSVLDNGAAKSQSLWLEGSWDCFGLEGTGSRQPLESWMSGFEEDASTSSWSGAPVQPQSPCRRVLVRCPNLATWELPTELDLTVLWCATISVVKSKIEAEIGMPLAHQRLSFMGRVLANDITILDCGATSEAITLQLEHVAPEMELPPNHYVRNSRLATRTSPAVDKVGTPITVNETWPGGQCYRVHLADGGGVGRLKERIERWTGLAPHMQILLHRGRELQADHTTAFYSIRPGDRLELACVGGFVEGLHAPAAS